MLHVSESVYLLRNPDSSTHMDGGKDAEKDRWKSGSKEVWMDRTDGWTDTDGLTEVKRGQMASCWING